MAGTSADKLALLRATKADLKAALIEKGQTPGDVFSTYPGLVRAINTGSTDKKSVSVKIVGNNYDYVRFVQADGTSINSLSLSGTYDVLGGAVIVVGPSGALQTMGFVASGGGVIKNEGLIMFQFDGGSLTLNP